MGWSTPASNIAAATAVKAVMTCSEIQHSKVKGWQLPNDCFIRHRCTSTDINQIHCAEPAHKLSTLRSVCIELSVARAIELSVNNYTHI